jgi:translation initiation factor 5B
MLEGNLLTGKQKEEQRKLEAMRRQFLVQSAEGLGSTSSGTTEVKEGPNYESTVDDESAESQSQVATIEEAKEQIEEVKPTWEDDNWDTKIWNDDSEDEDDVETWSWQFCIKGEC